MATDVLIEGRMGPKWSPWQRRARPRWREGEALPVLFLFLMSYSRGRDACKLVGWSPWFFNSERFAFYYSSWIFHIQ